MPSPRVHHLNCATMHPPLGRLIGSDVGPLARGTFVAHCLLLETERDGLVLVDSGFGAADVRDPRRIPAGFRLLVAPAFDAAEPAHARVQALGHRPEDVRHIVVTHLDLDHAGGLVDFPWAAVHLHAAEHDAAMRRASLQEKTRYLPVQWAHGPRWETYADEGDDFFGLGAVRPLRGVAADVALVPLHGHTRGHSAVAVKNGTGWLLHAGDAYFHHTELDRPRRCPPGLDLFQRTVAMDERARRRNQSRLRDLRATRPDDVAIFSAHDPAELLPYAGS
jgi:glyoxylase-like metal-dependent hydrolase (beta-lactamase superfamily II)